MDLRHGGKATLHRENTGTHDFWSTRSLNTGNIVEAESVHTTRHEAIRHLRVLIVGQYNSFDHILATNLTCWGYEPIVIPSIEALQGSEMKGDVLLYDLDDSSRLTTFIPEKEPYPAEPGLMGSTSNEAISVTRSEIQVRLTIVLSSRSLSRSTLEQIGAVAYLHKPFEMGRLQRYLCILQQLLYPETTKSQVKHMGRDFGLPGQSPAQELPLTCSHIETRKNKLRILVVDDVAEVVETIRQFLESVPGYEVAIAHDGLEALESYLVWQPDCIVTDLIMPLMNGYQVMRCLAACSQRRMPAFVVMSALTQLESPVNRPYLKDKVVMYVDKPFQIEDLLNTVEQALASYGRISN